MNWIKERYEAFMVIIGVITILGMCMGWMNSQFGKIETRFNTFDTRLTAIEKDLTIIKTVLVMKGIVPNELAHHDHDKQ